MNPTFEDHIYCKATDLIVELAGEFKETYGKDPKLQDLLDAIAWGIRGCSSPIFEDVAPSSIRELVPKTAKVTKKLKVGDVLLIPGTSGPPFLALYLNSNRFGEAFGVFAERRNSLPPHIRPKPFRIFFSGAHGVAEGWWKVIDNRQDLLSLFPGKLEIFHSKADHPNDSKIGKYGSAETASGRLRVLSKSEALAIGLLTNRYQTCYMEEELPIELERLFNGTRSNDESLAPTHALTPTQCL